MIGDRAAKLGLFFTLLVAGLGCASGAAQMQLPEASGAPPSTEGAVERAAVLPRPFEVTTIREADDAPFLPEPQAEPPSRTLDGFFARSREFAKEGGHLRIGVFGDSHIQADYWTGSLRRALQKKFGDGGLGFVHIGWRGYRHDGVRLERSGPWRTEPKPMTSGERQGDGVYGLSGVRVVGEASSLARLVITDGPKRELRLDFAYRLPSCPARARVVVEEGPARMRRADERVLACSEAEEAGPIEHLGFVTKGEAPSLDVEVLEGQLEIFGVVVETARPGVVVDALGIAGARADTPLAWDADAFGAELRLRDYDLVVLAYGTNDSVTASPAAVPAFGRHLTAFLERLREGARSQDCLVIGPMERGPLKRRNTAPEERIIELNEEAARMAEEQNCAFFSALSAMGGPGTIHEWAELAPPLAQRDLVHLTRAGYLRLGELLSEALLGGF